MKTLKATLLIAALLAGTAALAVAGYSPGTPYHRNPVDRAACVAYETAEQQDTPTANIDAIGATTQSGELADLIVAAFQRYGNRVAPSAWCAAHGYPADPYDVAP
jgi:hypothetical protein